MGRLELRNATKVFSGPGSTDVVAVEDASVAIDESEFLVLVGPSGSGKSTLLRLIAGLETLTEGEIYLDDERIDELSPTKRDLAMVFQNYSLYPHLTVEDNIGFGLRMEGELSAEEIERKVRDVAELLEIDDLLPKMPSELSGGQQQRVALGRAIVREPALFLMDEPLSNLDAKLRDTMRTEILELQRDLGVTTVYVTHDQTEAMTMGDRIAVLNEGVIQQAASPMELYYAPDNQFVARFIGDPSMNFLEGTVVDDDTVTVRSESDEATIDISSHSIDGWTGQVRVGIRPEDVSVVSTAGASTLGISISVVEPLGRESLVYFDLQETKQQAIVPSDVSVSRGQTAHVAIDGEKVHLFDPDTGETISNRASPTEAEMPSTIPT